MNKLLLLLCMWTTVAQLAQAQKTDSATAASRQRWYDYYTENQKSKTITGWILLGTGVAMTVGGGALIARDLSSDYVGNTTVEAVLFFGGIGAMLTSIPFFVAAGNNKRKARLYLKGEKVSFGNTFLPKSNYAALSFTLPL